MVGCPENKINFPFMQQENRSSNFNVFQRRDSTKDTRGSNMHQAEPPLQSSIQFPFANKLESLDSRYRYHEHKSEFDTPKITSKIRSFQKNLNGFTPISSSSAFGGQVFMGQEDTNNFIRNDQSSSTTNVHSSVPFSSFLKRPNDAQEKPAHMQLPNRLNILQSLRPSAEKHEVVISEYESRIGQKINRKVALTIVPLFCIVYSAFVLFDFLFGMVYERTCRAWLLFLS